MLTDGQLACALVLAPCLFIGLAFSLTWIAAVVIDGRPM